jgi:hypothetical protein
VTTIGGGTNRIQWTGLTELRAWLRNLPEHLTNEASGIVSSSVQHAFTEIYNGYPIGPTGNLRRGLKMRLPGEGGSGMRASSKALGVNAILYNHAPHAWFYDNGTATRRSSTRPGGLGYMKPTHLFVRTAIKWRTAMYARLVFMLEREGLIVTGSFDAAA